MRNEFPMTDHDIIALIKSDGWMMRILFAARALKLPDWMIGAGFIRNKIWDALHDYPQRQVQTADIDLVYFDPHDLSPETEQRYNARLRHLVDVKWEAINQARIMPHVKTTEEALSEWPETATCIAVRLEHDETLTLIAPHGIDDLTGLILRPSPAFDNPNGFAVYRQRITSKGWQQNWPKLRIVYSKICD